MSTIPTIDPHRTVDNSDFAAMKDYFEAGGGVEIFDAFFLGGKAYTATWSAVLHTRGGHVAGERWVVLQLLAQNGADFTGAPVEQAIEDRNLAAIKIMCEFGNLDPASVLTYDDPRTIIHGPIVQYLMDRFPDKIKPLFNSRWQQGIIGDKWVCGF